MTSSTRKSLLALAAAGALVLGALALPVAADEGDDDVGPRGDAEGRREAAREHREAARERHDEARERFREICADPANETVAERCEHARDIHNRTHMARREANAIVHAIHALERRIGRLEVREELIERELASGNLTDNETAELQERLLRIEEHQDHAIERLLHLQERLEALREKWAEVRAHVDERRGHGGDDDEDDADEDESEESDDDHEDDEDEDEEDEEEEDDEDDDSSETPSPSPTGSP